MCDCCEHPHHHGWIPIPRWHPYRGLICPYCVPTYISVDEEIRMLEWAKEVLETRLRYIKERLDRLKAGRQTT